VQVEVDRPRTSDGSTPLLAAIASGASECVQLLLAAGADPTHVNRRGETAHQLAERRYQRCYGHLVGPAI
jgi:ankyrin repeat protein